MSGEIDEILFALLQRFGWKCFQLRLREFRVQRMLVSVSMLVMMVVMMLARVVCLLLLLAAVVMLMLLRVQRTGLA